MEKAYCERCKWKKPMDVDNVGNCEVWGKKDDHESPKHDVLLYEFKTAKQNKNNDCKHYLFLKRWKNRPSHAEGCM